MKLADVTAALLRRAVDIYAHEAYNEDWPEPVKSAACLKGRTFRQVLKEMVDEGYEDHRRYVLRLGNRNYPCMKLAFEELLYDGEFFFMVDTHDDLDLDPSFPGYEDWEELRRYNRDLKHRIERAWAREGLPTIEEVRDLAAEDAQHAEESRGRRVVLAIDDPTEGEAIALALRAHGYDVFRTEDPDDLMKAVRRRRPDLVLVGHLLAGRSGRRIADTLNGIRRPARRHVFRLVLGLPRWDMREKPEEVDAVIPEPFDRDRLFRALDELLSR